MTPQPRILIVEDEMIIAADISIQLSKLGYEVTGINTNAEDTISIIENNPPDIILMDITLSGRMNGIEAAKYILEYFKIPVIFLTSNTDEATFQQAVSAKPYAYITKPFQEIDLKRGIEITLKRMEVEHQANPKKEKEFSTMDDRLFIKDKDQMVKLIFDTILFLQADRNYCKIFTEKKDYFLSTPLRSFEEELPRKKFIRTHRSYIVNLDKIDAISEFREYITIKKHVIPISRRNREAVVKWMKLISITLIYLVL